MDTPPLLPFTKMQAVGNDFVVIDEREWPAGTDWPRVAVRLCDRKFGIGSDGLLLVGPSEVADTRMRMFNPDGTEDMCGNGLRCVVQYAHERGWLTGERRENSWLPARKEMADGRVVTVKGEASSITLSGTVETLVGVRGVKVEVGPSDTGMIHTEMGAPAFHPRALPMTLADRDSVIDYPLEVDGFGVVNVSVVNTGSTHSVLFVDELPDDERFFALSPRIENHPLFPERTSVLWATVEKESEDDWFEKIRVRIWERGVGETLGCGTGACAVTVLAAIHGRLRYWGRPKIYNPHFSADVISAGGQLDVGFYVPHPVAFPPKPGVRHPQTPVEWEASKIELSGHAQTVFRGQVAWDG